MQPFVLILIAQTCCAALLEAQSPNLIGRWNVEITFANGDHRSLRFDAQGAGKGSLLLLLPRPSMVEPAKPSEVKDPGRRKLRDVFWRGGISNRQRRARPGNTGVQREI